jgi:ATP-dependent DNA helicase RecG
MPKLVQDRVNAGSEQSLPLKPSTQSTGSEQPGLSSEGADREELLSVLRYVKGVGPRKAQALIDEDYHSLDDLIFHFPGRYLDARELVPLDQVRKHLKHPVSVRGMVLSSQLISGRKRGRAAIVLRDGTGGILQLVYFDYPEWRAKSFKVGEEYLVAGYPGIYNGTVQIVQPPFIEQLERPDEFVAGQGSSTMRMLPLYYISPAVRKIGFKDKQYREIVQEAIRHAEKAGRYEEILPQSLLDRERFVSRMEAIREIHIPESPEQLELARRRLKYEEIFFLQLRLAIERLRMRKAAKSAILFDVVAMDAALTGQASLNQGIAEQVLVSLPYELTAGQKNALREILYDMSKKGGRSYPMNRLLQGDVGSGKTIVAVLAMLTVIENGYQCAFMVPTEVLAEQHYNTLTEILQHTLIKISLLVGGQNKRVRESVLRAIAEGESHIVIGTHALIEKGVRFQNLGFVVTDEQHRFGVAQRKALIDKSQPNASSPMLPEEQHSPDVLIMTATPIPRTLALTLYGDMDVSTIRELPKDRKPIKTMLFYERDHPIIYQAAKRRIDKLGEQVFIVYPLREKSEKVDSVAAEKAFEYLKSHDFKEYRVGLIHGKMPSGEKQETMRRFRNREFDILIATTVIEVGIDVPNATVMIIEHAERFGLAQLHQLRGRVGRGSADSACVLVASDKLAPDESHIAADAMETSDQIEQASLALDRLKKLVETSDGFEIAKADMEFRGTGEVLGLKQSGKVVLKVANLATDIDIVQQALVDTEALLEADPQLRAPGNRATRQEFLRLYRDAESYLHVG